MKSNRLPPITKRFTDESTAKYFQFTFYCDCCGIGWQTPQHPFSGAEKVEDTDSLTTSQRLIYNSEYDNAYEQANREAIGYFLACTDCGAYICEDCALKSYPGEARCQNCIEKQIKERK